MTIVAHELLVMAVVDRAVAITFTTRILQNISNLEDCNSENYEYYLKNLLHRATKIIKKKLSNKVISAFRLPSKCSFTPSKLRFFGLRKP